MSPLGELESAVTEEKEKEPDRRSLGTSGVYPSPRLLNAAPRSTEGEGEGEAGRWDLPCGHDHDPAGRLTAIRPSGTSSTAPQRFIYRDGLNPIAWQRPTTVTCTGGRTTDTAVFVYASMHDTPDLMYLDECGDGDIDVTYRLLTDERGSVRSVVNVATGAVVEQILYDAWGNPRTAELVVSGSVDPVVHEPRVQPFGFIGGIWDGESRLWRLGARDYDADIGRWTTKDPIGFAGAYNLYGYCHQDPVNCVDPSGLLSSGEEQTDVSTGLWDIWNLPGNLLGAAVGFTGSGMDFSHDPATGAVEFSNNTLVASLGLGAMTSGRVICYAGDARAASPHLRAHENAHIAQQTYTGWFAIPSVIGAGAGSAIAYAANALLGEPVVPANHSPTSAFSWLEVGPRMDPPQPWPW